MYQRIGTLSMFFVPLSRWSLAVQPKPSLVHFTLFSMRASWYLFEVPQLQTIHWRQSIPTWQYFSCLTCEWYSQAKLFQDIWHVILWPPSTKSNTLYTGNLAVSTRATTTQKHHPPLLCLEPTSTQKALYHAGQSLCSTGCLWQLYYHHCTHKWFVIWYRLFVWWGIYCCFQLLLQQSTCCWEFIEIPVL